jgi:hypothetical protein
MSHRLRNIASNSGGESFKADDASIVSFESFSFVSYPMDGSGHRAAEKFLIIARSRRYLIA